jgi:hypothetical protein
VARLRLSIRGGGVQCSSSSKGVTRRAHMCP